MTENELPREYRLRMLSQLGSAYADYLAAMQTPPQRALRVNTLKASVDAFSNLVDFTITPLCMTDILAHCSDHSEDIANKSVSLYESELVISSTLSDDSANILPACFRFPNTVAIGRHPLHVAGLCYVQEPAAQMPVRLLSVRPGMTVLDLCAAPGGKSGQLAAAMGNTGLLIANEPVFTRAETLVYNLERLGVRSCVVTCQYPDALCDRLTDLCDAVLVDAPCSGEGMFRRDPAAVAAWSVEHVHACALRQRAILDAADRALKPGGTLVYSTCTFSPEENEETVDAFLASHPDYTLLSAKRLYPHTFPGEGQFMAKLVKGGCLGESNALPDESVPAKKRCPGKGIAAASKSIPAWEAFVRETFRTPPDRQPLLLPDGRLLLPPTGYDRLPAGLRILRAGVLAGEIRQERFLPAHALAMATPGNFFQRRVPLAETQLTAYLAGETVPCDPALSGWCAATYRGYPLGFGKAKDGVLKNHLPKGLRVRG